MSEYKKDQLRLQVAGFRAMADPIHDKCFPTTLSGIRINAFNTRHRLVQRILKVQYDEDVPSQSYTERFGS